MMAFYHNSVFRALLHALFWLLSIWIFAFIFRLSESISKPDLIYSAFFHISIILCVYLNLWGIRKWFQAKKYVAYVLFIIPLIAFTVFFNLFTFNVLVDLVLPGYYFVSQFNSTELVIIILIYLFITSTFVFLKSWFELQQMNQRMIEAQKEKVDSELQSLKNQINPHFLFNSLNVIYSLTLKKDDSTPEVILKLSDILRYVIYDSKQKEVSLSSEVTLIQKYIDLQKYRTEEATPMSFESNIERDAQIAPLIFLTLVENSFKHGIKSDVNNVFIRISLKSDEQKIVFEIENNQNPDAIYNEEGMGLENIKKRLALQYPDRHRLSISNEEKSFKVYLEIENEI
jgi:sensor histidine kinase YesM